MATTKLERAAHDPIIIQRVEREHREGRGVLPGHAEALNEMHQIQQFCSKNP